MAASVSGDGRLAIWQRIAAKGGPSAAHMPSTTWRCFSTSTYRGVHIPFSCIRHSLHREAAWIPTYELAGMPLWLLPSSRSF